MVFFSHILLELMAMDQHLQFFEFRLSDRLNQWSDELLFSPDFFRIEKYIIRFSSITVCVRRIDSHSTMRVSILLTHTVQCGLG